MMYRPLLYWYVRVLTVLYIPTLSSEDPGPDDGGDGGGGGGVSTAQYLLHTPTYTAMYIPQSEKQR